MVVRYNYGERKCF